MTSTTFFFVFIPILAIILLAVNLIFAPHNPYQEKDSVFECGFHSFLGQNRTQFSISFFIFALLFLLFDLEILLVYPYVVSAHTNGIYGLVIMLIFFLALTLGFAFELGKNALKIDSRQMLTLNNNKTASVSYISGLNYQMLNLLSFFNSCDSPRSLGLYFINSATFQIEDLVELYEEVFGSTTMPPSVSPPSLTPEIGGIIILTLPLILILTDLLKRRYNRRPDIMVIDLRIGIVAGGAFILDKNDPSGVNLTNLYKKTENILWFAAEVPQRIYDYERLYRGMFVDLTSPLIGILRVLNPDLYEPILISQPFQGQSLGNIQFRVSILAPSSSQWLFMQNEYGLILQTEDHIIPFSSCMPINLRLNFYAARGGLTDRQLLIRHNINPDLFL